MTDAVVTLLNALTLISILMLVALGLAVIYGRFPTIGSLPKELRDWHRIRASSTRPRTFGSHSSRTREACRPPPACRAGH